MLSELGILQLTDDELAGRLFAVGQRFDVRVAFVRDFIECVVQVGEDCLDRVVIR